MFGPYNTPDTAGSQRLPFLLTGPIKDT